MNPNKQAIFSHAVAAATRLCPLITRAVVRARYGSPSDRLVQLGVAKERCRELLAEIELVELRITRGNVRDLAS